MILCYGSLGPDIVHRVLQLPEPGEDLASTSSSISYGGGAANPAVALVSWGEAVQAVGHEIGDDPLGAWLVEDLGKRGVDTGRVVIRAGGETPYCVVLLTPGGERTIVSTGYQGAVWQEVADWEGIDLLVVDGYSGAAGAARAKEARRRGLPVVGVDVVEAAPMADVVVWSRAEHPDEDEAERLAGGRTVVLTDGSRQVVAFHRGKRLSVRPPAMEVRDATGAGHVLAAMWAFGLLKGWTTEHTLRMSTAAASLLVADGRAAGIPSLSACQAESREN